MHALLRHAHVPPPRLARHFLAGILAGLGLLVGTLAFADAVRGHRTETYALVMTIDHAAELWSDR